uniref:glycosyltransferase n=1 Tax=Ningiella ruwaisensis TaxID=2364274 RepID=UPI00109F757D|nr:glycosyltransferase [Ningiella ruwaisensis]
MKLPDINRFFKVLKTGLANKIKKQICLVSNSELFKSSFFTRQLDDSLEFENKKEAIKFYLEKNWTWHLACSKEFDGGWYLDEYPDVRNANINPLVHFLEHGQFEGRLPVNNVAAAYEYHLWAGAQKIMLPRLKRLVEDVNSSGIARSYGRWALARWAYWCSDFESAFAHLKAFHECNTKYPNHSGPLILYIVILLRLKQLDSAKHIIDRKKTDKSFISDLLLLESNLFHAENVPLSCSKKLDAINKIFQAYKLCTLAKANQNKPLTLNNLKPAVSTRINCGKKVSVIIPAFNAAKYIETALDCLLSQTWKNLEVIIVDDASEDNTSEIVQHWIQSNACRNGKEFKLEIKNRNAGAYSARNHGMSIATGDFLTVHDADDYSHPQKIALQAEAIEKYKKQASVSSWVRCSEELVFQHWRVEESLIHRNVSSLMISRKIFDELGYWDQVRFGADTEYYERVIMRYGRESIIEVLQDVPLSFGLSDSNSLTNKRQSHRITEFFGVRKDYLDSARIWHRSSDASLYLDKDFVIRPFPIPDSLLTSRQKNAPKTDFRDIIRYSEIWDANWYISRYKNLQIQKIDCLEHFVQEGFHQNYDPCSELSISYLNNFYSSNSQVHLADLDSISLEVKPPFKIKGQSSKGCQNVLICGHSAGRELFGAERSFLDMVKAASGRNYRVFITLPSAENRKYIEQLSAYCDSIFILNDAWWQKGISAVDTNILLFEQILIEYEIKLVHVNTVVQNSVYEAVARTGIPIITHVRELLSEDATLLNTLCASAKEGYRRVLHSSDCLIANSVQTKKDVVSQLQLGREEAKHIQVIPNVFDPLMSEFDKTSQKSGNLDSTMRFGLISSNITKKGIKDAVELADNLEKIGYKDVEIVLIGPETELIAQINEKKRFGKHRLLKYLGYVENTAEIYANIDVVLNLSNFAESFGRTVLEGMAYGKPSLVYEKGALLDIVEHEKTGLIVPFRDIEALLKAVLRMKSDSHFYRLMSKNAKVKFETNFSIESYADAIDKVYKVYI